MRLCDALGVGRGDVVALVGGGGKTSALYRLGRELASAGASVVLSGTTRFTPPERDDAPNLSVIGEGAPPEILTAGGPWPRTVATGHGSKGRLLPVTTPWVDALHRLRPDWTIVLEADGSALRPFKAPAAHEPVIPVCATVVVSVVGIDVVGRVLDDTHVHRPEIVAALTGAAIGSGVDEPLIAATLLHPRGGRKDVPPGARWIPLINKADSPERLVRAERVSALLAPYADRVLIACLRFDSPVVRLLERGTRE